MFFSNRQLTDLHIFVRDSHKENVHNLFVNIDDLIVDYLIIIYCAVH